MNTAKNIFSFSVSTTENKENFVEILENNLQGIDKSVRKRIILCTIELIQNNLIYNQNEAIQISIIENSCEIQLQTKRKILQSEAENLIKKIVEVNSYNNQFLKDLYLENLKSENANTSTGNGLIVCKYKSDGDIFADYQNNILEIKLTFKNHKAI